MGLPWEVPALMEQHASTVRIACQEENQRALAELHLEKDLAYQDKCDELSRLQDQNNAEQISTLRREHEAERRRLVDEREHEAMEYKRFADDHAKQHKVLEQQAREIEEAAGAQLQQFEVERETWKSAEDEKNVRIAELEKQLRDATINGVQTSFRQKNLGGNNATGGAANALSPRPAKGELGRRLQRDG